MYVMVLAIHSILRWLVLFSLLAPILTSLQGLLSARSYGRLDAVLLKVATGLMNLQVLIGLVLYAILSPLTAHVLAGGELGSWNVFENQILFFALYHSALMIIAIAIMSIGGSVARKADDDRRKYRVTMLYYGISLTVVLAAIPWFRNLFPHF